MQGIIYKITPEQGKSVIDELREDIYELDVRVTRIEDDLVDYVTYDALDSKLAEYVTIDTVQTISAKKSFVTSDDPTALEIGKSSSENYSLRFNTKQDDSIELSSQGDISFTTNGTSADAYVLSDSGFSYSRNGSRDLGSSENAWRNAYVSGVLSDGVDSIAVGDIADKQSVATNAQAIASLDENKVDKVPGKGLSTNDFTDELETKLEGIEAGAQVNAVTSVAGKVGAVTLDKSDVGLGNVDNTSDLNKPISTATQSALANKADLIDGKVPSAQLPSYVDDVVEYASISQFPIEGEQGKIYIALDTGLCYRWSGSEYIQVAGSTSVLMFASQANFPVEGEEGVIYVAEDTNKQFRWTGSAYVELSKDDIEIIQYQSTTPLTDEQVEKAKNGRLIIHYSDKLYTPSSNDGSIITFSNFYTENVPSSVDPVSDIIKTVQRVISLTISTKILSRSMIIRELKAVGTNYLNFLTADADMTANGKQIARALNLRKTQDMIANVYDATATYAVGDYCIYQNDLYVCNTAILVAEAWNSLHWTKANVTSFAPQAMTSQDIADAVAAVPDPILANNSWETIAKVCKAGKMLDYWSLGDTKTDVGTDGVTRTFRICDAYNAYEGKVVFEQVELESTSCAWQPSEIDGYYNNYSVSQMRTTHLPAVLAKYSSELQTSITNTTYKVATNSDDSTLLELTDKLFLPAEHELFASRVYSHTGEWDALTQFQYYVAHNSNVDRVKHIPGEMPFPAGPYWWLRSPRANSFNSFVCHVYTDGSQFYMYANHKARVAPCFTF